MRKLLLFISSFLGLTGLVQASNYYDSPNVSTPSAFANMGLAGTFNFYSSTIPSQRTAPPLVISSTGGIYAPTYLGIEVSTGNFRTYVKTSSLTVTGNVLAVRYFGDGSGLYNLSTGSLPNSFSLATDTTTLLTFIQSTAAALNVLRTSVFSTYTALTSTGVQVSNYITSNNSTMTAVSISTTNVYNALVSTGLYLSALWSSALSSYTALTSTGITLSNFMGSTNSTMTAIRQSTATLQLATSSLQGITTALTLSTTTLGMSTSTLLSLVNNITLSISTIPTRIDQLQVFASTGQSVNAALSASTTTAGTRLLNGAITVYNNGFLVGNITTLAMGSNMSASATGSTVTVISVSTIVVSPNPIQFMVNGDTRTFVSISTINFPITEFNISTGGQNGSSVTITVSGSSHTWTAWQSFSSITAIIASINTDLFVGGNVRVSGDITSSGTLTSISLSSYPLITLIQSNQVWQMTTRSIPGTGDTMLVFKDASRGYERLQVELSSGLVSVGGNATGGLNDWQPSSSTAKFTVVGGSMAVVGTNARLLVAGAIQSASGGFVFPDGTTQTTAVNATSVGGGGVFIASGAKQFQQPVSTIVFTGPLVSSIAYQNTIATITLQLPTYVQLGSAVIVGPLNVWGQITSTTGFQVPVGTVTTGLELGAGTALAPTLYQTGFQGTGWFNDGTEGFAYTFLKSKVLNLTSGLFMSPNRGIFLSSGSQANPSLAFGYCLTCGIYLDTTTLSIVATSSINIVGGGMNLSGNLYLDSPNSIGSLGRFISGGYFRNVTVLTTLNVLGSGGYSQFTGSIAVRPGTTPDTPDYALHIQNRSFGVTGGSVTVTGGVSASTYTVNGTSIFTSSFSATQFDGYTLWSGSGTLTSGASTIVSIPSQSSVWAPQAWEMQSASKTLRVDDWVSSFTITNTGTITQKYWSRWIGR